MTKPFINLFVFAIVAAGTVALQQKFTLYELPDQQGDSHTFTGKYPDLSNWAFFLNTTKSYCHTGMFYLYDSEDFHGSVAYGFRSEYGIDFCGNFDDSFRDIRSGRITGPTDFYAPALAIYEGRTLERGGREIIVTTAANNFPFPVFYVNSFGNSSWTFFTKNNFTGTSWCFEAKNNAFGVVSTFTNSSVNVQSVIKGCNLADIQYYRNLYA